MSARPVRFTLSVVASVSIGVLLALASTLVVAKSFLWQASSGTTTVYLLGSIHMGVPSMYPMPHSITDAFKKSDYLVVEVNESAANQMEVQQKMLSMGTYSGTETLADHVDKKTLGQLNQFLASSGMPSEFFSKMKPGMIAITLSVIRLQQLGYSPDLGIDRHFIAQANRENKTILELETIDQQLELLLGFSDDALLLKHTMTQLDTMKEVTAAMIESWQRGDADKLNALMIEDPAKDNPEYEPLMRKLITDRNYTMADKVGGYLATGKKYFVIVGAGHLVGKEGIVSILKNRGFQVQQL